jgi:hypothetical protein
LVVGLLLLLLLLLGGQQVRHGMVGKVWVVVVLLLCMLCMLCVLCMMRMMRMLSLQLRRVAMHSWCRCLSLLLLLLLLLQQRTLHGLCTESCPQLNHGVGATAPSLQIPPPFAP